MLASGTLPDIIFGDIVFSDSDIVNNLSYFRPLDDYIDQYMPNLKAALEETPEMKKMSTFPDGKIYSLPARLPSRPKASIQPIINKAWLDQLGLDVPDNTDELYNVFKAFKEGDPNGNGKADEIPVSGSGNISIDLLNPFGITDINGNSMMVIDNEPVFYPVTENYKEAIKWAHKLYAEGPHRPRDLHAGQHHVHGQTSEPGCGVNRFLQPMGTGCGLRKMEGSIHRDSVHCRS